jgi:hypothetical protein
VFYYCRTYYKAVRVGGEDMCYARATALQQPRNSRNDFRPSFIQVFPKGPTQRAELLVLWYFGSCVSAVTGSLSGPRKLFKGVTTATSGVLARFPWLLPVRNSFASYGASAVARTSDRGHVAEATLELKRATDCRYKDYNSNPAIPRIRAASRQEWRLARRV